VVVAGALVLLAIAYTLRRPWSGDLGMHAATVERLKANLIHPGNPLVDTAGPSAYYTPYTVILALVCRVFGLSALAVLAIVGPVNVALLLWGLRRFVRQLTDLAYAPVLAGAFLLLLWGLKPRVWSGFFSFWALPLVMSYPSTIALALTLLLWAGLAIALRRERPRIVEYAGLGLLAGVIALVHQFTFATAGLGALALVAPHARKLTRTAWLGLAGGAAEVLVLLLIWPYYSLFALIGSSSELDAIHRPLYDRPWIFYGLIVFALPALWLRFRRDRLDPLVLLFMASFVVVCAGWLTGHDALGRIWPAVLLAGQLALAVELAGRLRATGRVNRVWLAATGLACAVALLVQAGNLLYLAPRSLVTPKIRSAARMYVDWPDYSWITPYVHSGDVVLTNDYFGIRTVVGYGAYTIAPAWPDPLLPDEAQRERDLATMTAPTTYPGTRTALLAQYHVRWVLEIPGSWTISTGRTPVATGPRGQRLYRSGTS
jgi:hypothetical protein